MKTVLFTVSSVVGSAVLFAAVLVSHIFFGASRNSEIVDVRVEQGEPFTAVVHKLHEQKVITNERLFTIWARITGAEKKVHWGLYRFDTGLPPREVLHRMVIGKAVFQTVTVPEGLTVREVADLLAKLQIAEREKFLTVASDPDLLKSLGLESKGLEGYLFPNTYHFTPSTSEKEIITTMVEQFRKASEPLLSQLDTGSGLSAHEIVTLASIIEKETGVDSERPLVSAVFHNRLKLNMSLQSDPTVIYGLRDFNGDLTRKDLKDASPYNTYRIPALPPGPICNPSLASIKAALAPADVPYLFFVSKNDGTHAFSENLETHNQAVKALQPSRDSARQIRKGLARSR